LVIDPKIPLFQPSPPSGEGKKFPSLKGRDLREGDIFMLLCEPLAHVDSRENGNTVV